MCVLSITIIIIRMMEVIKLASSTEFATKIRKVSNFCTEVIHFKLEALRGVFFSGNWNRGVAIQRCPYLF